MKPSNSLPPLDRAQRYTIEEARLYLRKSRPALYKDINAGKVRTIVEGRRRYVPGSVIAELSA